MQYARSQKVAGLGNTPPPTRPLRLPGLYPAAASWQRASLPIGGVGASLPHSPLNVDTPTCSGLFSQAGVTSEAPVAHPDAGAMAGLHQPPCTAPAGPQLVCALS